MRTFFVILTLFFVTHFSQSSFASSECLDLNEDTICYNIEGTEPAAVSDEFESSVHVDSMLVASDLAHNNVEDLMVVSSDLFKAENQIIEDSIYQNFSKADELYYRFAYKILDRNNRNTTVVITRD